MEILSEKVKAKRLAKSWTQQHLADACDLSLRTIQRVEKEGNASNETLMSLCAVFEVESVDLLVVPRVSEEQLQKVSLRRQVITYGLTLVSGTLFGACVMFLWMS